MILCYVTDRHSLNEGERADAQVVLSRRIAWAAAASVDWIQIREKDMSACALAEVARAAITATRRAASRCCVIVNDRIDVALAAGVDGVHFGAESVPAAKALPWLRAGNAPADFVMGVSCHEMSEATAAERAGANYVFFGPVFETPSKKSFGPPQGIHKLAEVCKAVHIPVLAIGGVNEETAGQCVRAGAAGIAAIRIFQQARDSASLGAVVSKLRAFEAADAAGD